MTNPCAPMHEHQVKTSGWSIRPGWKLIQLHREHKSLHFRDHPEAPPLVLASNSVSKPLSFNWTPTFSPQRRNSFSGFSVSFAGEAFRRLPSLKRHRKVSLPSASPSHRRRPSIEDEAKYGVRTPPGDRTPTLRSESPSRSVSRPAMVQYQNSRWQSSLPRRNQRSASYDHTCMFQAHDSSSPSDFDEDSLPSDSGPTHLPPVPPRRLRLSGSCGPLQLPPLVSPGPQSVLKKPGTVRGPKHMKKVAFLENTKPNGRGIP